MTDNGLSSTGARLIRLAVSGYLILGAAEARAEQWYVEPRASVDAFYDDNVRLTNREPRSTSAARAKAEVEAGRRTEVSEIGISANVLATRYSQASDLDETDAALGLKSAYQLGRHRFGLDGALNYDSTLTSEIATSGLVQTNKRRERILLSPSWTYSLTSRLESTASFSYQNVAYEDVKLIPLFNYRFDTAGLTLTYALSERSKVFGRATYARYDADEVNTRSNSYGVEAGANYLLTETMSLTAFAGVRNTKAETPTFFGTYETENTGPIFELALTKSFDQGQFRVTADRSLVPSSSGTLLDTTALGLSLDYRLGPRWTFLLAADGYRNRTPEGDSSGYDRDYLSLSPRLRHRLTQSLDLELSYRYRWQSYDSAASDASSNAVYLTLRYSLPREPLGRWSRIGR